MYYKSRSYKIFYVFLLIILAFLAFLCVLPMINVLAVSFSGKAAANANLVTLWPVDFTWDSYAKTLQNDNFLGSLLISVERTVIGTALGLLVLVLTAYPLSKGSEVLKGRNAIAWFFVFTMLFSGGLVPTYILMDKLHLMNSIWALILPNLAGAWNIILMLNFFRSVPKELEEASLIDGAGYLRTLFAIYVPVSMPAIATLAMFQLVWHWNSWFDGLIYLSSPSQWPLSTLLQSIIVQADFSKMNVSGSDLANMSTRTVKSAQIFIGALPILVVYPFLQKYFVKGMVLGAVKE